jgi:hypothetical protein
MTKSLAVMLAVLFVSPALADDKPDGDEPAASFTPKHISSAALLSVLRGAYRSHTGVQGAPSKLGLQGETISFQTPPDDTEVLLRLAKLLDRKPADKAKKEQKPEGGKEKKPEEGDEKQKQKPKQKAVPNEVAMWKGKVAWVGEAPKDQKKAGAYYAQLRRNMVLMGPVAGLNLFQIIEPPRIVILGPKDSVDQLKKSTPRPK